MQEVDHHRSKGMLAYSFEYRDICVGCKIVVCTNVQLFEGALWD